MRIPSGGASTRRGPAAAIVDRARAAVLRLIAVPLGELLSQLERDRHRTRTEIEQLKARIDALEAPKRDT